jgi:hypothetical protein
MWRSPANVIVPLRGFVDLLLSLSIASNVLARAGREGNIKMDGLPLDGFWVAGHQVSLVLI